MNTSKQINAMIVLLALLLVGVGVYTIWDPFRAEAENDRTRDAIAERAAKNYVRNCSQCHGEGGEGRIGPALEPGARQRANLTNFANPVTQRESQSLVRNTLVCGRIGAIMPPWAQEQGGALNDEQIRQLVILITDPPEGAWDHVRELAEEEHALVPLPPVADVLKGASITGSTNPVCGQRAATQPPVAATPPPVATDITVVATDNRFDKNALAIPAGQQATITVRNEGNQLHNIHVQGVRATDGTEPQTPLRAGGTTETIRFTITQAGSYTYICDAHPAEMRGTLFVQ